MDAGWDPLVGVGRRVLTSTDGVASLYWAFLRPVWPCAFLSSVNQALISLINKWKEIEGEFIKGDQVDDMNILVKSVETRQENTSKIVEHFVQLLVDGQPVTIDSYDTKLSMLI